MKQRVTMGVNMHGHWMLDLDCGHVVIVYGEKRPSSRQECRYCNEKRARELAARAS